jgi:hypothetical protein
LDAYRPGTHRVVGGLVGDSYHVKMTAADSGGISEASLVGSIEWWCKAGEVTSHSGPGLETPDVTKHGVWPSGQVCSEIVKFRDFDFSFDCPAGYQFSGGLAVLTGVAKNFYGGVKTSKVIMHVQATYDYPAP